MTENNGGGSATTVLVSVIIVVLIGAAFYFGFVRGNWGGGDDGSVNVELNAPDLNGNGE